MKITSAQLKKIISEEIARLTEEDDARLQPKNAVQNSGKRGDPLAREANKRRREISAKINEVIDMIKDMGEVRSLGWAPYSKIFKEAVASLERVKLGMEPKIRDVGAPEGIVSK